MSGEATQAVDTNLMLILDVSGSMDWDSNVRGMTCLEEMVNIITFVSSATDESNGWVTVDDAKKIILGLSAEGSTKYMDALNDLMTSCNDEDNKGIK